MGGGNREISKIHTRNLSAQSLSWMETNVHKSNVLVEIRLPSMPQPYLGFISLLYDPIE